MPHPTKTPRPPHHPNALPVKHPFTIQDGGIEVMLYGAFHSKITPALQASFRILDRNDNRSARVDPKCCWSGAL